MSDSVATILVGVGGLALGVVSLIRELCTRTSKYHYDHAIELYDLLDRAEGRGPFTGPGSSSRSEQAHQALVRSLEIEARAHTVLHMARVGRLSRPGSYVVAAIASVYAFLTASMAGQAINVLLTSPADVGNAAAAGVGVLSTIALAMTGARGFIRRSRTRKIRRVAGLVDLVSVEGVRVATSKLVAGVRSFRHQVRNGTASPNAGG